MVVGVYHELVQLWSGSAESASDVANGHIVVWPHVQLSVVFVLSRAVLTIQFRSDCGMGFAALCS